MTPFRAIVSARFRVLLQYRAAAIAGIGTQLFFGLVFSAGLKAFYASADFTGTPPLSLGAVVTYVWLGQAMLGLLPWRMDDEVKAMVNSGGLAYELLKPTDLYSLWFARAVALRLAPLALRAIPLLAVAWFFFDLQLPASPDALLRWSLGLAGAVALSATITVLMNISLLWTLSGDGVQFLVPALSTLLSGSLLPLPLFPAWAQPVLTLLPFRGIMDTPHRLWLGDLSGPEAWLALGHQWLWIALLILAGRAILSRGLHRVVLQGG
jgi:ABC-2 type transport system permease protein